MYVICILMVTMLDINGQRDYLDSLEGKLLKQTELSIVGNFSGDAKRKGLSGDYSEVLVPKTSCEVSK